MTYLTVKALHLIGAFAWFAGLFYSVRLLIYLVETRAREEPARTALQEQLTLMARRLWYGITWPAMLFTLVFGAWLLALYASLDALWVHVKVLLVLGLVGYHLLCGRIRKQLAAGECTWTGQGLRVLNEVATLFLVAIVFVAVQKVLLNTSSLLLGVGLLAALLGLAVLLYRRARLRRTAVE